MHFYRKTVKSNIRSEEEMESKSCHSVFWPLQLVPLHVNIQVSKALRALSGSSLPGGLKDSIQKFRAAPVMSPATSFITATSIQCVSSSP